MKCNFPKFREVGIVPFFPHWRETFQSQGKEKKPFEKAYQLPTASTPLIVDLNH